MSPSKVVAVCGQVPVLVWEDPELIQKLMLVELPVAPEGFFAILGTSGRSLTWKMSWLSTGFDCNLRRVLRCWFGDVHMLLRPGRACFSMMTQLCADKAESWEDAAVPLDTTSLLLPGNRKSDSITDKKAFWVVPIGYGWFGCLEKVAPSFRSL